MVYSRQHQGDSYSHPYLGDTSSAGLRLPDLYYLSLIPGIHSIYRCFTCPQHGAQCFCGVEGDELTRLGESSSCTTPCTDKDRETCGRRNTINVYYAVTTCGPTPSPTPAPTPAPPTPAPISLTGGYSHMGCFEDSRFNHVLTGASFQGQTALTIAVRKSYIVCFTGCGVRRRVLTRSTCAR